MVPGMKLRAPVSWLVDETSALHSAADFLAGLSRRLLAEGLPLSAGALTLAVPHPIIARRTWLWRADTDAVIEALGFTAEGHDQAGYRWLAELGSVQQDPVGAPPEGPILGWAGLQPFDPAEADLLRQVARFSAAPLAAVSAREASATLLEAYLGRRSAARVQAGALRRGDGEIIRAVLLSADLRDFTAMSEATPPAQIIAALDAWFDRIAGAVHAFRGEVLKFIGDGVLAIFPVTGPPAEACEAALSAVNAARAGMAHLDAARQAQGLPPLPFGVALHLGRDPVGQYRRREPARLYRHRSCGQSGQPAGGAVSASGRSVLISGAIAAHMATKLVPLGEHKLRGIAPPCLVFTLPDA